MQDYPTSQQINQEEANRLFDYCAFLVIENLPLWSEFGIDLVVYKVGDKFRGVKLIPPGLHFVYASGICKSSRANTQPISNYGPRCGFYHNFKPKELLVKRWSVEEEEFDQLYVVDQQEYERYKANLHDLDRYLGSYDYFSYQTYLGLTNKLDSGIIDSLTPTSELIRSVPYLTESNESSSRARPRRLAPSIFDEKNLLPNLTPKEDTVIRYTEILESHHSKDKLDPSSVTKYNLDTTQKISNTFGTSETGHRRLLAELQFAFLTFLLCHVYDCFEQWKKLLCMICLAEDGLTIYDKQLFEQFIDTLSLQIQQIPQDLFEDIIDTDNLMRTMLDTFFSNIADLDDECYRSSVLKEKAINLKTQLGEKFHWTFDIELDDDKPVVVDLNS